MGFEVWIAIVLAASGLSGWIGYAYARKGAPKQSELDAMAAELDAARQQAESVQANVSEHFEQSAVLFGKLAADYREFLDHFSASAQNLGLSEARARELIEQGFQPLLTHEAVDDTVIADTTAETEAPDAPDTRAEETLSSEISDVTVEMPDETIQAAEEQAESEAAEVAQAAAEEVAEAEAEASLRDEVLRDEAVADAADEANRTKTA